MKIYYDCEFLEGTQTRRILGIPFGKTKPTIDLVSIGMLRDEGQEYYAISKDFNLWEAWNRYDIKTEQVYGDMRNIFPEGKKTKVYWIRENVLKPIFQEWMRDHNGQIIRLGLPIPLESNEFTYKNFKKWLKLKGKSNKQIAVEVQEFVYGFAVKGYPKENTEKIAPKNVELYGYYSAYDHCALCWLFGKMIDLPSGFPMYTKDLKQIFDEKQERRNETVKSLGHIVIGKVQNDGSFSTHKMDPDLKNHPAYPKQRNEHSAIHDARWNKQLHEFLNTI